jgi:hypothetical protein
MTKREINACKCDTCSEYESGMKSCDLTLTALTIRGGTKLSLLCYCTCNVCSPYDDVTVVDNTKYK